MTKEENVKLAIKLIEASLDGKTIEYKSKIEGVWDETNIVSGNGIRGFNFQDFEFRIKPEKKLVPFTFDDRELFMGKWIVDKEDNCYCSMIITIELDSISLNYNSFTYEELLEKFTFLDGSPCGKEVEE